MLWQACGDAVFVMVLVMVAPMCLCGFSTYIYYTDGTKCCHSSHKLARTCVVDDPALPGRVLAGGRLLNWRLREECITRILLESGGRVSEVTGLSLGDWMTRGMLQEANTFSYFPLDNSHSLSYISSYGFFKAISIKLYNLPMRQVKGQTSCMNCSSFLF